jgi:uncharacterized hydrophobic protein (TIGR00271 family)
VREVLVRVPAGRGEWVVEVACSAGAAMPVVQRGDDGCGGAVDLVILHLPNSAVGELLEALGSEENLHVAFQPSGSFALQPPHERIDRSVRDVTSRSPVEILLAGVQSIGSWKGFLSYAAASGVVVWLGLTTETVYLLVAAMLISPFAGPAMNTAIATARGDFQLLWRSIARYVVALAVAAATAAVLSLIARQDVVTDLMSAISSLSRAAFLLPLAAGAAGALHLSQSERSSLVSGAAVGMLVAASLAPPAGLIGIGVVIGDGGMVGNAAFLLALQLVGINLAGAAVFWLFGVRPEGSRYSRGRRGVFIAGLGGTAILLALLLTVQLVSRAPALERSSIAQQVRNHVLAVIREQPGVEPARVVSEFTRPVIAGAHTLLVIVHVQSAGDASLSPESGAEAEAHLARTLAVRIAERFEGVHPLVHVSMMTGAGRAE